MKTKKLRKKKNYWKPVEGVDSHVRAHMRRIGAKGGEAAGGTLAARTKAKRAAAARWRREHPLAKNISKKEVALHSSHAILADNNNKKQQQHEQKTIHRAG
jgi:hypothetical protein